MYNTDQLNTRLKTGLPIYISNWHASILSQPITAWLILNRPKMKAAHKRRGLEGRSREWKGTYIAASNMIEMAHKLVRVMENRRGVVAFEVEARTPWDCKSLPTQTALIVVARVSLKGENFRAYSQTKSYTDHPYYEEVKAWWSNQVKIAMDYFEDHGWGDQYTVVERIMDGKFY